MAKRKKKAEQTQIQGNPEGVTVKASVPVDPDKTPIEGLPTVKAEKETLTETEKNRIKEAIKAGVNTAELLPEIPDSEKTPMMLILERLDALEAFQERVKKSVELCRCEFPEAPDYDPKSRSYPCKTCGYIWKFAQ